MPDISMCAVNDCELRKQCYRYMAVPSKYWQSYLAPEQTGKDCKYFWKVEPRDRLEEEKEGSDS